MRVTKPSGSVCPLDHISLVLTQLVPVVASVQRELDAEVEHSKKLQSDFSSRRPAPAPTSAARGGATHGAVARELEKKIELLEGLSGVGILNYTESIRQPGNSRSITYTCMLSIDERGSCILVYCIKTGRRLTSYSVSVQTRRLGRKAGRGRRIGTCRVFSR